MTGKTDFLLVFYGNQEPLSSKHKICPLVTTAENYHFSFYDSVHTQAHAHAHTHLTALCPGLPM